MVLRGLGVGLVACLAVGAQQVVPPSHSGVEGSGATNVPFGRSTGMVTQLVYDGANFGPGTRTISQIGFRVDGGTVAAGKGVELEIAMGTSPRAMVFTRGNFSQNRGVDYTVVRSRRVETLPAASAATSPNPFTVQFTLDQAFTYDPAQGPLLVEITVFSQQPGAYTLDATFVCNSPMVPVGPAGCGPVGGNALRCESTSPQVLWGQPLTVQVLDALPGNLTALALGTRDTGVWNGWTLPHDLGPQGAPGCPASIDMIGSFHQVANGGGTATYALAVPNNPALQGLQLYFQGVAIDRSANALGIVTSQAFRVEVCGWEKAARVYAPGNAPISGVVEVGIAPVIEIQ